MKKALYLLTLLFILSSNCFAQELKTNTYKNDEYKYSFNYPADWNLTVPKEYYHVVRVEYRNNKEMAQAEMSLRLMYHKDTEPSDAAAAQKGVIEMMFKGIEVLKNEEIEVNGFNCVWSEISYDDRSEPKNKRLYITCAYKVGNDCYIIIFDGINSNYEKNKDLILNCLKSLKING